MKLATLCDIKAGQIVSRLKSKDGSGDDKKIKVLLPKAIQDGWVVGEGLALEMISKEPPQDCLTKAGDIVLKLSSPYGAAYITEKDEGLLVPSFCCRLSGFHDVDPHFLVAYFNSNKARFQYEALCGGAVIAILRIGSVRELDIPECPEEVQVEIGERYRKVRELRMLVDEAARLEMDRAEKYF